MSTIRASGYRLTDVERLAEAMGIKNFRARDDSAFQMLLGDVQRLKQEIRLGSNSGAGGTQTGITEADVLALIAANALQPASILALIAANALQPANILAGTGITVTPSADAVTIAATATPFNSRPFWATLGGTSPTLTYAEILDPSASFSAGTYTFAASGTFYAWANVYFDGTATAGAGGDDAEWEVNGFAELGGTAGASASGAQVINFRVDTIGLVVGGADVGFASPSSLLVSLAQAFSVTAGQTVTLSANGIVAVSTTGGSDTNNAGLSGHFGGFYLST